MQMYLQTFARNKAPHMLPESASSGSERKTENIILSSNGEERDYSMTDRFSMKELKDALKKVKTRKAPGS